jgi:hypothetical protein
VRSDEDVDSTEAKDSPVQAKPPQPRYGRSQRDQMLGQAIGTA